MGNVSVVIPAKNEQESIGNVVAQLKALTEVAEVIVVDDGSSDATATVAREAGARVVSHPYSKGNGAAIKSGVRSVNTPVTVFMDADGQHQPADVRALLAKLAEGYDMVVGARKDSDQASPGRLAANKLYNRFATYMVGRRIEDLTSGFRAVDTAKFREFLYLYPNGFSYPTTSTMAFFRAGYSVAYIPIEVLKRVGNSHISPMKDGIRFLLIIFKIGSLYSPLKVFFPISVSFLFAGLSYYGVTYFESGRFTNMSALLFSTSVIVFLIGLVSEQITSLLYRSE